ncbi:hypothetical protein [Cellulophaga sp. L1A9]|uniref:hypothetical protein n=1 Tax=Cellulophaga sp. L1A9 TaxID=2686362 RepID=UPI00131D9FF3|nr:hypothetical protein [Cellulophaga sp. L1A9]
MRVLNFYFTRLSAILLVVLFNFSCSSDGENVMDEPVAQEEIGADGDTANEDDTVDDAGTIFLTDNLIVDASKAFVNYTLPAADYEKYINEEGDVRDITKEIYNHFNDDYDLIVILAVETVKAEDTAYGINTPAKNSIQGLGGSVFDATSSFGSGGRLNGVIFMPRTEFVQSGPFLHEIAHLWANKGFIATTVSGHWGYASTGGQLGGFDALEDLGDNTYKGTVAGRTSFGTFANGGNSIPYSNVELYLMGLIPENELASIQVAINPVAGNGAGEFTADEIKTYTAQELIAANGKRVPSYEDAQKEFTALTVIISPENAIDDTKKEEVVTSLEDFFKQGIPSSESTYNFWTATGERAHFSNIIDAASIK